MLNTTAVSPGTLKPYLNFNNTVLLALYVPTLPKWRNFSLVLDEVHGYFQARPELRVHVLRADCSAHTVCSCTVVGCVSRGGGGGGNRCCKWASGGTVASSYQATPATDLSTRRKLPTRRRFCHSQ